MAKTTTKAPEPTKAELSEEAKKAALDPQAILGKIMVAEKEYHFNLDAPRKHYRVSSGSLNLDGDIGGGFGDGPQRIGGENNTGKTPFLLNIIDTILDEVPQSRGLWFAPENRLSDHNRARVRHPIVLTQEEWKVGTILFLKTGVYDVIVDTMRKLVMASRYTDDRYAFVIDSLDNMILKCDIGKPAGQRRVAGAALMTKEMFMAIGAAMREFGHWFFPISQKTAEIKADQYAPATNRQMEGSGGNSLSHNVDEALEFMHQRESDLILEKPDEKPDRLTNKILGHILRIKLRKSSTDKRHVVVEIPIKHTTAKGNAIWREREITDQLLGWGLLAKTSAKSSWLELAAPLRQELKEQGLNDIPEKVQGLNQMTAFLEGRKDVTDYLFAKFRKLIGGVTS